MKIPRALHLGKSPETEEPLPQDSIGLQQEVKAALEVALDTRAAPSRHWARPRDVLLRRWSAAPGNGRSYNKVAAGRGIPSWLHNGRRGGAESVDRLRRVPNYCVI